MCSLLRSRSVVDAGVLGSGAIWVAIAAALIGVVRSSWQRIAATVAAVALCVSTATLGMLLWSLDLSYVYVVDHAHGDVGPWYRLAGLWGGAAGSLLLLATMVAAVVAACAWWRPTAGATRVGLGTVAALASIVAVFSAPFDRLAIAAIDGGGLQPILEHPAMLYHPPLLYLGLVACWVPFALVIAACRGADAPRCAHLGSTFTCGHACASRWRVPWQH